MAVSALRYVNQTRPRVQYTWLTWLVLSILLVGPLVGPLFSSLGWPILNLINWPLYLMGENVCPQPDLVFQVLGYPMLVCSRCWSGVFGLWMVLLSYKAWSGSAFWLAWRRIPELGRVAIALLAFGPWVVDIVAAQAGWWYSSHTPMMLSGILGGLGAGALILPFAVKRATPANRVNSGAQFGPHS